MTTTIQVRRADVAAPVADGVTEAEKTILYALCALKSSYRADHYARSPVSVGDLSRATDSLVARGWATKNKAGSVAATIEGKNARSALGLR